MTREVYCEECGRWIEAGRTVADAIPTHDRVPPCRWICRGSGRLATEERVDGVQRALHGGSREKEG